MKYYIILFIAIFLFACRQKNSTHTAKPDHIYASPLHIALDTVKGYTINNISGDSIKTLWIHWETVKTGAHIPFNPTSIIPVVISTSNKVNTPAATIQIRNITQPFSQIDPVSLMDTTRLKKIPPGKGLTFSDSRQKCHSMCRYRLRPNLFVLKTMLLQIFSLWMYTKMSSSYIYTVLEDRNGNIWMGTESAGLSKYNGVSFFHYGIKEGLSSGTVLCILEDKDGNILAWTINGLNKFDGHTITH